MSASLPEMFKLNECKRLFTTVTTVVVIRAQSSTAQTITVRTAGLASYQGEQLLVDCSHPNDVCPVESPIKMYGWAASGLKILIAGLPDSRPKNR